MNVFGVVAKTVSWGPPNVSEVLARTIGMDCFSGHVFLLAWFQSSGIYATVEVFEVASFCSAFYVLAQGSCFVLCYVLRLLYSQSRTETKKESS